MAVCLGSPRDGWRERNSFADGDLSVQSLASLLPCVIFALSTSNRTSSAWWVSCLLGVNIPCTEEVTRKTAREKLSDGYGNYSFHYHMRVSVLQLTTSFFLFLYQGIGLQSRSQVVLCLQHATRRMFVSQMLRLSHRWHGTMYATFCFHDGAGRRTSKREYRSSMYRDLGLRHHDSRLTDWWEIRLICTIVTYLGSKDCIVCTKWWSRLVFNLYTMVRGSSRCCRRPYSHLFPFQR